MKNVKTWFISGASRGFGLELARQLLQQGQQVAATSRSVVELRRAIGEDFDGFLPLEVELASESSVAKAVDATIERFDRIDVVVNNAGYGQLGSLEELTDDETRANFDVNVFGTLNVIRHVMPHFRRQRSGHVINYSSIAGRVGGFAGWGVYCATKFAVEGFSEALAAEVAPFGVKVTIVEPGYFRTDFLKSGSLRHAATQIPEYELVRQSEAFHRDHVIGNQPGDPMKAGAAIIQVAEAINPPLHLLLGQDAFDMATSKLHELESEMQQWKTLSLSTGFVAANEYAVVTSA